MSVSLNSVLEYARQHWDQHIQDLMAFLKHPSISTLPSHDTDTQTCASWLKQHIDTIGFQKTEVFNTKGHPIVYGEYIVDSKRPTLLIYGHYDVQPVDPIDQWDSPPFSPSIRDGYLYARGASDNKGMVCAHLHAISSWLNTHQTLPINVKCIIEGEEEIGSPHLPDFLATHRHMLSHDALIVSDSPMFSATQPSVCTSLRGLIYLECTIQSMAHAVHSGQLGGAVPNIIHYASHMLASLKDPVTNRVTLPGFYDDVISFGQFDPCTPIAQAHIDTLNHTYGLGTHANNDLYDNIWHQPTLDCNGMVSGFIDDGAKTVIPNQLMLKLSCRLVPNQSPQKINAQLSTYIQDWFPSSFSVTIRELNPQAYPLQTDPESTYVKAAIHALSDTHQKEVLIHGEGGSIPILAECQRQFGTPIVLIGLNAPNDNIHAPNERFSLQHYQHGIHTMIRYMHYVSDSCAF